ncbi:hypothetical protein HanXRQr2_Chr12g0546331 [Helianthus annuus]|uniref:Uncharacterized protein n=1 Tax=Helianthus annuus TaxID=4232 RepID=A0A9K3MWF1_HELAN|nr:hypothetical protein HanXRQr2_Chr12g0546331 [Helianthus annuus]KAJ0863089.1 hypothetical protein HanPSC8_Chr12g0525871 [Helianthus annuus]
MWNPLVLHERETLGLQDYVNESLVRKKMVLICRGRERERGRRRQPLVSVNDGKV